MVKVEYAKIMQINEQLWFIYKMIHLLGFSRNFYVKIKSQYQSSFYAAHAALGSQIICQ